MSDLKTLAEHASADLAEVSAAEALEWTARTFGDSWIVASNMQDAVLIDLAAKAHPGVDVLFLDTGYHFAETIGTRDAVAASYDVRIVNAKVADLYDEMITAAGERNLWIVGGGNVASQFADEGLLDDVLVTVVPVVLGAGKPLFDHRVPGGAMQLMGTRTFDTGMVELRYEIRL